MALRIASWTFALVFLFVAILVWGIGGKLQCLLILGIALILVPPFRALVQNLTGLTVPWWGFALAGVSLWAGVMAAMLVGGAFAMIHGFFAITLKVNQVVSGLALTLLGNCLI